MGTRRIRLAMVTGIGVVSLALAGCLSLPREARPIHTFILGSDSSAEGAVVPAGKPGIGVLLVNVPVAQPGFDTPRMAFTQRDYEVSYYATHQWADPPAGMLVSLLVQTLEQTGYWRAIVTMPTPVRGDHRVEIDQFMLVQTFEQTPSQVRVALRIQVLKLPEYLVLGTRMFDVVEEAASDDAYGGAVAANRAVVRLVKGMTAWLNDCAAGSEGTGCSR